MLTKADIEALPVNLLVPHYLASSYLYYQVAQPAMTDDAYDRLCVRLRAAWKSCTHRHKKHINYDDLEAGTCLLAASDYPAAIERSLDWYLAQCRGGQMAASLASEHPRAPKMLRRAVRRPVSPLPAAPAPALKMVRRTRRP